MTAAPNQNEQAKKRCEQCGRYGTRGFHELPVRYKEVDYGVIVECSNRKACARRYERQRPAWVYEP